MEQPASVPKVPKVCPACVSPDQWPGLESLAKEATNEGRFSFFHPRSVTELKHHGQGDITADLWFVLLRLALHDECTHGKLEEM